MPAEARDPVVIPAGAMAEYGISANSTLSSCTDDSSSRILSPYLSVFKDGHLLESLSLDHAHDQCVLVGRHNNCDIILSHPSISRHHLEIQVLYTSQEFLLNDLNSVHGTWVNGTSVPPMKVVKVKEGDSIKLGASSRTYVLQWLPSPTHHPLPQDAISSEEFSRISSNSPLSSHVDSEEKHSYQDEVTESKESVGARQPSALSNEIQNEINMIDEMKVSLTVPETKNETEKKTNGNGSNSLCNNNEQQEERSHVSNNSSRLWLRRTKLNPPPQLFTPVLKPSNTVLAGLTSITTAAPSAPPLPSCYSLDDVVVAPSAPPLPVTACSSTPIIDDEQEFPENQTIETSHLEDQMNSTLSITRKIQNCSSDLDLELGGGEKSLDTHEDDIMDGYESDKENGSCVTAVKYTKISDGNVKRNSLLARNIRRAAAGTTGFSESMVEKVRPSLQENSKKESPEEDMETYASDKENHTPASRSDNVEIKGKHSGGRINNTGAGVLRSSGIPVDQTKECRVPFQCLPLPASRPPAPSLSYRSASMDQECRETIPSPVMMQTVDNSFIPRKLLQGVPARSEQRRLWHIVVDMSCFLDSESFKALRLLEGIREVRLIVPKIVISELDCFRAGSGKVQQKALKWIESCMVKLPSWIHVQSSSESMTAVTPPGSPCLQEFHSAGSFNGDLLLSPTNADHVLNCAILFSTVVSHGKVALLTNDTALRIKAMAEGLVCDAPPLFCESLVSPYSDRFLWSGSLAHGYNNSSEKAWHVKSTSALAPSVIMSSDGSSSNRQSGILMDTVRAMATYGKHHHHHHAVEGLNKQCGKQAKGLKLVLT